MEEYFYRVKEDNSICLIRCMAEYGVHTIPEYIDGYRVTEIGPYCFSESRRPTELPENWGEGSYTHRELTGNFVEEICLPDSVTKIDRFAFYNCKRLMELELGGGLLELGNDAFMNCVGLKRIVIRAGVFEKTGIRMVLEQIRGDIRVSFLGDGVMGSEIMFPEFSEVYDEIGPAHIFELSINGEGFRSRQCFRDGIFNFEEYDNIFPQACAKEDSSILLRMAVCRLAYPSGLSDRARSMYVDYIRENCELAGKLFIDEEAFLEVLFKEGCLDIQTVQKMIVLASERKQTALAIKLMEWKSQYM